MGKPRVPGEDPGRWNEAKGKTLLFLFLRTQKHGTEKEAAIGIAAIHKLTGVPYRTLLTSCPKWHRWGYIKRFQNTTLSASGINNNRRVYHYTISDKGIRLLLEWARFYLPLDRYQAEMNEWQRGR